MADINELISDNLGLVYSQLRRFNMLDDQDAESLAYEALYRAIQTYNPDSGNTFSTYAVCVVSNALRGHLRTKNKKRQIQSVSYFTLLKDNEEDGHLLDLLHVCDTAEDAVVRSELYERVASALSAVREEITTPLRLKIFDAWCESEFTITQKDLAKQIGTSQTTVSVALGNFKHKLKKELEDYL